MFAPIRWRKSIGLHARLVGEGVVEKGEEAIDLREVFELRFLNRCLSKVVAQHVFWIHPIHAVTAFVVTAAFVPQSIPILRSPPIEAVRIEKVFTQFVVRRSSTVENVPSSRNTIV